MLKHALDPQPAAQTPAWLQTLLQALLLTLLQTLLQALLPRDACLTLG